MDTTKDINDFYDESWSMGPFRNKTWVESFCTLILKIFNPRSIIDFGCGSGDILAPFENRGVSILGIDGSKACQKNRKIRKDNFILFDLRNKYKCKEKYDICFCFEVAEHIKEEYSERLIENLTESSSTILFTAAPYGQGGLDHINLKSYGWWIRIFQIYGFSFDEQLTDNLKKNMEKIVGIQEWYINNMMVFKE